MLKARVYFRDFELGGFSILDARCNLCGLAVGDQRYADAADEAASCPISFEYRCA